MAAFAFEQEDFHKNPKTLCEWVKNFRIKKTQMKRKLRQGGDLRVCAILSTALNSAERELRRKQQERFNRWLEIQSRLHNNNNTTSVETDYFTQDYQYQRQDINDEKELKRRQEITDLWKYELSELDEFMKNISSKPYQNQSCTVAS